LNRKVLVLGLLVVLPLIGVLLINLGRNPNQVESPLIGRPAPEFSLPPLGGGEPVTLASLRGRPVVMNFWATWCVPCLEEHEVLTQAASAIGPDAHFLGVVYDDEEPRVRAYLRRRGSSYPSLLDPDGKVAIAFGVYGVPETFFIDGQGTITAKYVGPLDPSTLSSYLREAMRSAPGALP
jgi:cytochrome c biogenesis protein CcmG/thiol:disulfide interchange protein DsbE